MLQSYASGPGVALNVRGIALRVQSTQIWSICMVNGLGNVIMVWGTYFLFGYLDP